MRKAFKESIKRRILILLIVFIIGFAVVIVSNQIVTDVSQNYEKSIENQDTRYLLGMIVIKKLNSIEKDFLTIALLDNPKELDFYEEQISTHIQNIKDIINVLQNGGEFNYEMAANFDDVNKISETYTYTREDDGGIIIEVIDLTPKIIEIETLSVDLIQSVNDRFEMESEDEILAAKQQIGILLKQSDTYFQRSHESAVKIFYAAHQKVLQLEQEKAKAVELYQIFYFASILTTGIVAVGVSIRVLSQIREIINKREQTEKELKKKSNELEKNTEQLEEKVKERTSELNEKLIKLEKGETATFNMMQDLKQTMKELEKIKNEIENQNIKLKKLNSIKSVFLNVTSHELRTPLSGIKGYVQMTLDRAFGKITDEQKDALELILQNTDHLNHIVQDILDSSQIQSGTMKFVPKETDIKKMVNGAVDIMQPSAKLRDIKITSGIKPNIPELFIDNDRIKQVITNLIGNAIKFSPEQTVIDVRAEKEKNNIKFEVQDQGRGIPKEKQKKIFEMFYQVDQGLDRQIGGVGLGLAISMGLLSAHGGKIDVESPGPGKGSTFSFTLPIESVKDVEKRFKDIDLFGTEK